VREADISTAEKEYSEDMFNELKYELRDIYPQYSDMLPEFLGVDITVSCDDLYLLAMGCGISEERWPDVVQSLLWFCFLGIKTESSEVYAYQLGYSRDRIKALLRGVGNCDKRFTIHPAFHRALLIGEGNR